MERMDKDAFDELKRRAAELWPDLAKYLDTAHLEYVKRWNQATRKWEVVTLLTLDVKTGEA